MSAWPPPPSALAERTTSPAQPTGSNNGTRLLAQSTTETPALHSLFDAPPLQSGGAASLIGFAASSSSPSTHKAFPSTANEGGTTPSLITSSPWSTGGIPSLAASKANTYGSRHSPELSAFYGQTMSPESSHDQGTSGMGGGTGLAGGGSGANPSPRLYASSSLSRSQRHPAPPAELGDDGKLFHQRDEMLLPRRNHTIASGGVDYRRRLERQFQQQASRQAASPQQLPPNHVPSPVTSPTKNSLSAITGGEEEADSDWEAMIKRKESLIPTGAFDEDTREELDTAPWRPIPAASSSSAHRRFPSQPNTTFGTSPVDSTSSSLSGTGGTHQRSESAHANRGLNEGPFASSPIIPGSAFGSNAGLVRRHQSLNYHAGRQASNHLRQGRQEEQQQQRRSGLVSPALSMTQASESGGAAAAPAIRSSAQQTQSSSSPAQSPIGTNPFPFSDRTPAFSGPHLQQRAVADDVSSGESGPSSSATQLSTSLMDAHAQLMRMSLNAAGESQPGGSRNEAQSSIPPEARLRKLPSLVTNRDELARGAASGAHHHGLPGVLDGPVSASAYVPPIGHGHHRNATSGSGPNSFGQAVEGGDHRSYDLQKATAATVLRGPQSAFPIPFAGRRGNFDGASGRGEMQYNADRRGVEENGGAWHADSNAGAHHIAAAMNANRQYQPDIMRFGNPAPMMGDGSMFPEAALASQMAAMSHPAYWMSIGGNGAGPPFAQASSDAATAAAMAGQMPLGMSASIAMPAHLGGGEVLFDPAVSGLIQSKGYNPPLSLFNVNPIKARFFVIKSFTEDDVQRSLKHEIWASTEKGNQRLDRAFKESSGEGPLYLLFSVNASGHFCGIAEMLTPLDYSSDSNVWAQEGKWKGSFKVRWIYVKDVPNNRLRHIRLTNTPECKPITQSRDTQELPADGGRQALKIIAEFPSRTTLLQDWLFYEQKQPPAQEQEGASASRPQTQATLAQDGDAKRPHTPEAASPAPRQHQTARSPLAPVAR